MFRTEGQNYQFTSFPQAIDDINDDTLGDSEFLDTEGIGYASLPGGVFLRYVEHVNGAQAEACFGFVPTRHELKILAAYWYRQLMEMELLWFSHQTTDSTPWRTINYATRRIARIRTIIGDLVDDAIAVVDAEFRDQMGEAEWDHFKALCDAGDYAPW